MMKRVLAFAFLSGILSLSSQSCLKQNCNKPKPKTSYLNFNVDDIVTHVYVNGVEIPLSMSNEEAGNWMKTHSITLSLYEGDTIAIAGKDKGGLAGIIGTLQFYDKNGVLNLFHTGPDWKCNNFAPALLSLNNGSVWPFVSCVDSQAQWIWNYKPVSVGTEVLCSFTLPYNKIN